VRRIVPGDNASQVAADRFEVNLSNSASLTDLHGLLRGRNDQLVGCIVNFLGVCPPFHHPGAEGERALEVSKWTFNLIKEFEEDLRESQLAGGGCFLNVTGLGGKFGLENSDDAPLNAAGTLGITKALHREAPSLMVKAIDVDLSMDAHALATRLLEEFGADDGLIEVGLTRKGRWRLDLQPERGNTLGPLPLDSNSVVLVTGGAFGVTADSAIGLARAARCRLVLVGRSTWPVEESSETAGLEAPQLRAKLIAEGRRRGDRMVPAEIERAVNRILKNRQIRANIAACQAAGSQVEYHAMDVRDRDVFGALIDDVYARYGRLDGVIHGAGVIEDKRIRDKTPDSFENVWRTKVDSALTLAAKLRPETLQFLVFFSSVSGRFGNAGQVDYCAANEFLNKLADHLSCRWPAKVVAINWGPWDGGMVTDELRRMYATVGFELIPIDEGVEFLLAEIRRSQRPSAEIVVSASVEQMLGAAVGSGA
jgi:NAD(P)-dependent dehydrogenase (short-subunit alcohol dehydrogenase family)